MGALGILAALAPAQWVLLIRLFRQAPGMLFSAKPGLGAVHTAGLEPRILPAPSRGAIYGVVGGAFRCWFSERRRGYPMGRIEPCGGGWAGVLFWDVSGTNGLTVAGCLLYFAP
jgi:hypothetical protein